MSGWNYPLRGGKYTLFEGGTRVSAFISGGAVPAAVRGTTSDSLIHEVDWLPTLLYLAGAKPSQKIDGVAQWEALTVPGTAPARTGLIYNIDPVANLSGIRYATRTTLSFSECTCGPSHQFRLWKTRIHQQMSCSARCHCITLLCVGVLTGSTEWATGS